MWSYSKWIDVKTGNWDGGSEERRSLGLFYQLCLWNVPLGGVVVGT